MTTGSRRVLVWRWGWLAPSETFIRSQFDAYASWTPIALGAERVASASARPEDRVLFGSSPADRVLKVVFRLWDWSPRLKRAIRSIDPDLIHAHFGGDASRVRRVARQLRKPLIVTLHGADVTARPSKRGMRGMRNRHRLTKVFRDADLLIAVSEHIAQAARELGADGRKLVVLPIGVPWSPAPSVATRSGILFVGRFVEKKGIADLVAAYARLPADLKREHPLRLVGAGPLEAEIAERARHDDVDIEMPGFVPQEVIATLLAESAVLAVPSHMAADGDTEGLPTVVFEAARASIPIVGYAHAGIPEAVQHEVTGLLAPERDVATLARYLERVLRDPQYACALGSAGRKRFEREFVVDSRTAALEKHYDGLIIRNI
ncbi:glycosyltransferase [Microbacterium sp. NPDC058345]|uniref:glycosyltransferase n=1 Tax=Microbacterium sp. NPDC058345 TaxID=3346455 RepID=UPI003651A1F3